MTMSKSHVALVLIPLLVAACSSESDSSTGEGGSGGGETVTAQVEGSESAGGENASSDAASGEAAKGGSFEAPANGHHAIDVPGRELGRVDVKGERADDDVDGIRPVRVGVDGRLMSGDVAAQAVTLDLLSACDVTATALAVTDPLDDYTLLIPGTTVGALDEIDTCWSEPSYDGGEKVYAFDLAAAGIFTAELTTTGEASTFKPALVVRNTCTSDDEWCQDLGSKTQKHASYQLESRVYVIVDTRGEEGTFDLMVGLKPSECGDGIVGPHEECDPGGAAAGDGCSDPGHQNYLDDCQVEAPAANTGDSCTSLAAPVSIPIGPSDVSAEFGALTTHGFGDSEIGTCMPATGGPDRIVVLNPEASGSLTVKAGMIDSGTTSFCSEYPGSPGCFDVELYARSTCNSALPQDELDCSSDCCDGETITFPVTEDVPVYLFVDGYDAEWYSQGPFNLHFNLTAN